MTEDRDRLDRIRALVAAEPDLSGRPDRSPGGPDGLPRLCRAAARALPAWGVGLSVMTAVGTHGAMASSDGASALVEELQFTLGEGPCLDAVATGRPVLDPDLRSATARWPAYATHAYAHGVRAVFAFPMQIGAMRLGALDVYRDRPGPLDRPALRDAAGFAEVAMLTLLDAQAAADDGQVPRILDDGLDARAELFQAQGMVTVQLGVGLAEAMTRLRAYAYLHDRPLLEVARAVLARRVMLEADPRHLPGEEPEPTPNDPTYDV